MRLPRVRDLPEPLQPFAMRRLDMVREGLDWLRPLGMYSRSALNGRPTTFTLGGTRYRYLWHPYMSTWRSERAVELPIAWSRARRANPAATLEVGNVLSNYFPVRHTVLDKYEQAPGVINEDVVDFDPGRRYELIVSVSTLEHVGWDEGEPRDPEKVLRAIDRLRELLTPEGELLFTVPHGSHTALDGYLSEGRVPLADRRCLKRVSADGRWSEVSCDQLEDVAYDSPFPYANGVTIGVVRPG
jgi:hypothetical protein